MYDFDELIERKGTQCIKFDAAEEFLGSDDLIPMWVADMDFRTPSFVIDALRKRLEHEVLGYPLRTEGFYQSIINWYQRNHQWNISRSWISFSPGVVPAFNLAVLAFTEPGDKIIVQPPVYFPFFSAITDHGRKMVSNPLVLKNGRLSIDFADLEKKATAGVKMIILSSPHNPGGSVWSQDELSRLAEICLKHNILMFSDEIHCDLVYQPHKFIPLASISPKIAANTITAIAPSKTFNLSGLGTAAVIISDEILRKKFTQTMDHLHIGGGNVMGNIALEAAYTHGDEWSKQLIEYLSANLDYMETFIAKNIPRIKMIRPQSTFLVWLDCRDLNMNDPELKDFFLHKAKLGLNPGAMFGQGGEGFMRMNIGCPLSVVQKALDQLQSAVASL